MSANLDEFVVVGPSGFGKAIREFRHQRGLTQQQLAERADMHRSYLARLESGAATEALQQLNRALAALGLEVVVRTKAR
jgi:transcriptional regulator with XRE-family HTH domain